MPPDTDNNANKNAAESRLVSVIVCTRNRGDNVLLTARAVLASEYPDFELLIMDQSDDDAARDALAPLCEQDSRIRYFRLELPGKPGALNRARLEARGRYLALTDDDCEPDSRWIGSLVAAFESDPKVGAVFGDVRAAPHDNTQGYIPDNPITREAVIYSLQNFLYMPAMVNFGIGANMAVRADALAAVQGWDPCIGPGAKFRNGDDHDVTARLLMAGYAVAFQPDAHTLHYGFRMWNESARDVAQTGFGFGVAFVKYLRCGKIYPASLRMLRYFVWQIVCRAARRQRPLGVAFPRGWVKGAIEGCRHPIERKTRCFVKMDAAESRRYGEEFAQVVRRTQQAEFVAAPDAEESASPVGAAHSEDKR